MEKHQHQNYTENDVEKIIEGQSAKQSSSTESPAPASSSPSHEFSFSVSLYSLPQQQTLLVHKSTASPNSLALDLSPADDIFFHGHLLPLHFLSHLPASPGSSTNSMDSFTLPTTDSIQDETPIKEDLYGSSMAMDKNERTKEEEEGRCKSKSFSLFRLRGRKGCEVRDREDTEKQKKKQRFQVIHALKKYLRMVQPLMSNFTGRRQRIGVRGQSYSYSENLSVRNKSDLRGRRGEYSAPASIRTSPTNSGLLLPTMTLPPANDSTMEELQAAIQAAIAHCKNSIAKEEKLKC
ncbi:LOW QUALITY PROTEIN: BRI1 kinase inhibitor 1-like [Prosopis cineraria]|uniref:LOW QUALITY PROTEIN: BRI1 kinase inhibitor 1-like n=1 Tax=Prosopis cineraria TaxID=364024 RepID=UPI00240FD7A3|nr:LOW QUALITY PROTEIN: BRI1 kinase inhibitor 1-like [Prosopis cineraria]